MNAKARSKAAATLGRRGGLKGGKARARALTPERRKEIARMGAMSTNGKITIPITLAAKLGSLVVHADEWINPGADRFDEAAIRALLDDSEIREWVYMLGPLVPVKR